jgi:hypothetical protein
VQIGDVADAFRKSPLLVSVTIPLHDLIPKLNTRPELTSVARMHGVGMYSRLSVGEAKEHMLSHVCNCADIVSLMSMVNVVPKNKAKIATKNAKAYVKGEEVKSPPSEAYILKLKLNIMNQAKKLRFIRKVCQRQLKNTNFPPRPAQEHTLHRIITNSSESVQPNRFIEAGCAVCG